MTMDNGNTFGIRLLLINDKLVRWLWLAVQFSMRVSVSCNINMVHIGKHWKVDPKPKLFHANNSRILAGEKSNIMKHV